MLSINRITIRSHERGVEFRDGEVVQLLGSGTYWRWSWPWQRNRVDVLSMRQPLIGHSELDLMASAGILARDAAVVELAQHERALVWIDGVFDRILGPGRHAYWTAFSKVRIETFDARTIALVHPDLPAILKKNTGMLEPYAVPQGSEGLVYHNGVLIETVSAGQYAFWKDMGDLRLYTVEIREGVLDVAGQELMTADKVTLRLNAIVVYRVTNTKLAVTQTLDFKQALYREAQLALRAAIGTRTLDQLLAGKDAVVRDVEAVLTGIASAFGLTVSGFGIRDVVLPGDMKELLNKVIEAEKAAEASLITRREETAAMRSQVNTARLLENNPTLMRLKELEVIEKIASHGKLSVMVGDKGLSERLLHLVD
jgi:SPFH domain / Band 7 family